MVSPITIEPSAIYDDGALLFSLGLSSATLARARRNGSLRYSRPGRRVLYLGQWVLDWLRAEGETRDGGPNAA
jgi:hypothetical protein